jgi:hypothetical protein
MAALEKSTVEMVLGGTRYTFMWGTKAIREMQELLSTPEHLVSPEEIFAELKRGRLKFVCAFIWAGLQKHHPNIPLESKNPEVLSADDILDGASEAEVDKLLKEFGLRLTPAPDDMKELSEGVKKNPRQARAKRGTGGNSSSRPVALA